MAATLLAEPTRPDLHLVAVDATEGELGALMRAQALELERERRGDFSTGRRRLEALACDLDDPAQSVASILERQVDRREPSPERAARMREAARRAGYGMPHLLGETAWLARPALCAAYVPTRGPCPGCGDSDHLGRNVTCLICSAGGESHARHPMQDRKRGRTWDGRAFDAGLVTPRRKAPQPDRLRSALAKLPKGRAGFSLREAMREQGRRGHRASR